MSSSGTTAFNPFVSDIVIDAFQRCKIKAGALTAEHMYSARTSCNLVLNRMVLRGVNLWKVDPIPTVIDLTANLGTYPLTADVVGVLDTTRRTGIMALISGAAGTPQFPSNATFSTVSASSTVSVKQAGHGFIAAEMITINEPVIVGGLTLIGNYLVATTPDSNDFTFNAGTNAASTASNTVPGSIGTDIILTPISRSDYAAIPNKSVTGAPTVYYFNREISPSLTLWPVPPPNNPFQLQTYLLRQIQDANPVGGQTLDLPYRAFYAFTAGLAYDLALKWVDELPRVALLKAEAAEAWQEFSDDDREKVSLYFTPDFSSYFSD